MDQLDKQHIKTEAWVLGGVILLLMVLRAIPEFQIGKMPIGVDTTTSYVQAFYSSSGSFVESLKSFNILYYLFRAADRIGLDAFFTIKFSGVVIFGLLNLCFYVFIRSVFKTKRQFAIIGVLIFGLQLATLRLSWDLFRNELGIIFAFLSFWQYFSYIRDNKKYHIWLAVLLGILTLGAHQMVGLLYLIVIILAALYSGLKKIISNKKTVEIIILVLVLLWPFIAKFISYSGNSLWAQYGEVDTTLTVNLFSLLYLPIIPYVIVGLAKNTNKFLLNIFTLLLLIQSILIFVLSSQGFYLWDRWMYMLVIPFTIYAIFGIEWFCNWLKSFAPATKYWTGLIGLVVSIPLLFSSITFLQSDTELDYSSITSELETYFPKTITWNVLGQPNIDDITQSVAALNDTYNGSGKLYTNWKYMGVIYYYLPELADDFIFVRQYTKPKSFYYVFGEHTGIANPGTIIDGASESVPVYQKSTQRSK